MKRRLLLLVGILCAGIAGAEADNPRPARNVTEFGAFVADKSDPATVTANTVTLNRALDKVGGSGGGAVVLPAGVFYLAPSDKEIKRGGDAAIHIRHDHMTLRGAGIGKTVVHTRSAWSVEKGNVVRGSGIRIEGTGWGARPRHDIVLSGFELDGGAGFTGHFGWPASTKDGDGWDITHKGIILSIDDYVDDVTLDSIYVHGYRGEVIYAGGSGLGKVRLEHVRSEDTNASTFNITANFIAEDCEFGKSRFWAEIGTRGSNKSGTFRRCDFHDSSVTGFTLAQGDGKTEPYLFENCTFENTPGVFGLYGGVGGPVVIRNNTFTHAGTILSSGYSPGAIVNTNNGVLMENNQAIHCGELVNFTAKSSDWVIRKNTFTGIDPANPGLSTAVVYGAAEISNCAITDNQFTDCRTPEQSAWVKGERPLFLRNIYNNPERRDAQATFTITASQPRVTPHFEEVTIYSGDPKVMPEFETVGYPDGQELTIRGGTPEAPVKFSTKAASYTVRSRRTLKGIGLLRLKFDKKTSKWVEMAD
jgi:hypothetical protein